MNNNKPQRDNRIRDYNNRIKEKTSYIIHLVIRKEELKDREWEFTYEYKDLCYRIMKVKQSLKNDLKKRRMEKCDSLEDALNYWRTVSQKCERRSRFLKRNPEFENLYE